MIEHMFQELWNFFIEFPRLSLAPIWRDDSTKRSD
jgi:hypothetical protein